MRISIRIGLSVLMAVLWMGTALARGSGGEPTYMYHVDHTGYTADQALNTHNASQLGISWAINPPNGHPRFDSIFSQPVVSQGHIYFGSWDGYEYAMTPSGHVVWKSYLGRTVAYGQPTGCAPPEAGISSTATVSTMRWGNQYRRVLFVGGGNAVFYAVDASTGRKLWGTRVGSSPSHYLWSSPAVYNGSVYIGVASFGDCPEVQGQVLKLNAHTGAIQAVFDVVPDGCRGGAVWSSPTIDPTTGMVYVTTGNPNTTGPNQQPCTRPGDYSLAFVKLRASDLTLVSYWTVPPSMRVFDSDFGTTPTLFTDSLGRRLVGASNKDGYYYALDRDHIAAGPVWRTRIAVGGACPQCGDAPISPAAFDGRYVYAAGGKTTINGQDCGGSVRALDPKDGSVHWARCFQEPNASPPPSVLGAVTATPSLVIVGSASNVVILDKADGQVVRKVTYQGGNATPPPPYFWGAPYVSGSTIYAGNMSGALVAICPVE